MFRAQRRLPHNFQEHTIKVIIRNREVTGLVAKWAVEIGIHSITYELCTDNKSQSLTDFLVDWTETQQPVAHVDTKHWTLFFDSYKNIDGAGASIVLISHKGNKLRYVL
ncbi:hypothetical protein JBE27_55080 [Streptomyces albiflaviniger]|nr:hypothetical protein [Streptomyces albiflaviniger]